MMEGGGKGEEKRGKFWEKEGKSVKKNVKEERGKQRGREGRREEKELVKIVERIGSEGKKKEGSGKKK